MTLKLHNTLTKKIEPFAPLSSDKVTLYTCGPTVYNFPHVGNWAGYIFCDTLVRTLLANDYKIERVMNITDVGHLVSDEDEGEDKLQKGAHREGITAWEVAKFYTDDFLHGMKLLNMIEPEHISRATDFIEQQLALVRTLKNKGYTYQIDDGIYVDTSKFPTYADFAGLDLAAQRAGARVAFNEEKRNPSDFALWKFSSADEHRDMEWDTPLDLLEDSEAKKGFPGWHLECSAMAMSLLGPTIDIHTGGIDHIPVHHTNEIAQSESASGQKFANMWLHNNHLKVDGTKISKSLGNGFTLQDLENRGFDPMDYRLLILQGHYSNEGNFTLDNLRAAKNRLKNWRNVAALRHQTHDTLKNDDEKSNIEEGVPLLAGSQAIVEALNNNLDTPTALKIVDGIFAQLEAEDLMNVHQFGLNQFLETIDALLGLNLLKTTPDISDEVKRLILERQRARSNNDWETSDKLRDELTKSHIGVRDTSRDTIWFYI
ncbi:MAG: cysS [Candidatus Saccharibacteria bacterium]|nr:cysS [Candidatus Saccharibacteria bacterium]